MQVILFNTSMTQFSDFVLPDAKGFYSCKGASPYYKTQDGKQWKYLQNIHFSKVVICVTLQYGDALNIFRFGKL